jgi:2-oxoglutarate dehydrogenase E1 component
MWRSIRKVSSSQMRGFSENFYSGTNAIYVEQLHEKWLENPSSVHASWQAFFAATDQGITPGFSTPIFSNFSTQKGSSSYLSDVLKVHYLLQGFQRYGYMLADLDPLKLTENVISNQADVRIPGPIRYENYKFNELDLDREFDIGSELILGFMQKDGPFKGKFKLKDLLEKCKEVYSGKIGFDYMHIPFRDETNWIKSRIETHQLFSNTIEKKLDIFYRVAQAQLLEEFFHKKFSTHKRFGLDGSETVVLAVHSIIERAIENGVDNFVIGMPHRGRLNVMANILETSLEEMFGLFYGLGYRQVEEGDVKYHLGQTTIKEIKGKKVTITLLPNPSHLETVDPVVVGQTRAIQNKELNRKKTMAIVLHGDAALAGQGVVFETIQMEDLFDYSTGGVVHIVINNNIGFTTTPREARSGPFPTEIAKSINAPIFHVNGDCPEEVDFVSRLAADWRSEFRNSVFIDIIGYRRYGHNELDEPLFTNPKMYQLIQKHTPVLQKYTQDLIDEGVIDQDYAKNIKKNIIDNYEAMFAKVKLKSEEKHDYIPIERTGITDVFNTGVDVDSIREIGTKIHTLPSNLKPHPQITKIYQNRLSTIEKGAGIDWGTAEALAWGSILSLEKMEVRISGQDVQRGTFSHRHSVIHDQSIDRKKYVPLNNISSAQAPFTAANSHLSEYGVLGFEHGYSTANPNALVLWEAQFGDFANGAQIIIDQYITCSEAKWGQESGLVLLLPHGYDGQGAEHSCARLGRFLQASSEDPYTFPHKIIKESKQCFFNNIQVANPTTPANYFHFLRRQIKREFRKPLIVMSPKRLLRHKSAVSDLTEFAEHRVRRVYDDSLFDHQSANSVRKVILCSGQVYYDLVEDRKKKGIDNIAICRIEQLAPFPFEKILDFGKKYTKAEFQWVQEEPLNLGAWQYVEPRILTSLASLGIKDVSVVSRPASAAAATGYSSVHNAELLHLLERSIN